MLLMLLFVAAYLLGSIPFAIVSSKLFGLADPRGYGSGNPGATNVLRSGNRAAAAVTLVGDAAKGLAAVLFASWLGFTPVEAALVGFAAFLGHVFSIFLRGKGGKGVATALGVLCGINVWIGLCALSAWFLVVCATRYASLASIIAAIITPVAGFLLLHSIGITFILTLIAGLLIWRHRENICKLRAGTERKIGGDKKKPR